VSAFVLTWDEILGIVVASFVLGAIASGLACDWLAERKSKHSPEDEIRNLHGQARADMNEAAGQSWRDLAQ
jgi:hypothetical protein